MKRLSELFLRESMQRAKEAGITSSDLAAYVREKNIPPTLKVTEWRDLLDKMIDEKRGRT